MKNMMKVLIFPFLLVAFVACDGGKSFSLTGNIDGTTVEEAYLAIDDNVDTVAVEDGAFVFKGKLENPTMAALMIEGRQISIMLENTEMNIEGPIALIGTQDQYDQILITGSASQDDFVSFLDSLKSNSATKDAYIGYCSSYIEANPGSYFTPYVVASVASLFQPEEVLAMIDALNPEVAQTKVATELKDQITKMQNMNEGGQAPDFTMNDVDGNAITLSDVYAKHKYLLIDFWASWCSPCRAENPTVVAAYEAYKDRGFSVFGVSLDKEKDAWVKAIADDKLTWEHVSDLKGWESTAAKDYAVRGIPANFLVDSKGKIVAKNLRGPALEAKLKELLD